MSTGKEARQTDHMTTKFTLNQLVKGGLVFRLMRLLRNADPVINSGVMMAVGYERKSENIAQYCKCAVATFVDYTKMVGPMCRFELPVRDHH